MKLHLIRHAKATSQVGTNDISRKLSTKGILQAKGLSEYLNGKIDGCLIWCSDAARTRQTLNIIEKEFSIEKIKYKIDFYLCPKEIMLQQIWNSSLNKDLVIIGHNYGISDLLNYFTGEMISMQTGEYICIDFGELTLAESSKNTGVICDQFRFTS